MKVCLRLAMTGMLVLTLGALLNPAVAQVQVGQRSISAQANTQQQIAQPYGVQSQAVQNQAAQGQTAQGQQAQQGQAGMQLAPQPEIKVGYRLAQQRTFHSHDPKQTEATIKTLESLGCQVSKHKHNDHFDIRYESPNWKMLPFQDMPSASKWMTWLTDNGFETMMVGAVANAGLPSVRLRMPSWKTFHLKDEAEAKMLAETYGMLGCEVTIGNHGNHFDANVRCAEWAEVCLPTPKAAHAWQDWLNTAGFETQHDHKTDAAVQPVNNAKLPVQQNRK